MRSATVDRGRGTIRRTSIGIQEQANASMPHDRTWLNGGRSRSIPRSRPDPCPCGAEPPDERRFPSVDRSRGGPARTNPFPTLSGSCVSGQPAGCSTATMFVVPACFRNWIKGAYSSESYQARRASMFGNSIRTVRRGSTPPRAREVRRHRGSEPRASEGSVRASHGIPWPSLGHASGSGRSGRPTSVPRPGRTPGRGSILRHSREGRSDPRGRRKYGGPLGVERTASGPVGTGPFPVQKNPSRRLIPYSR